MSLLANATDLMFWQGHLEEVLMPSLGDSLKLGHDDAKCFMRLRCQNNPERVLRKESESLRQQECQNKFIM